MNRTPHGRQRGFTMLEVLISMVIIAFGLLGVAGLQAFALKNSQSATFRSTAVLLAADLSDRVRANAGGAIDGNYNQPDIASYGTAVSDCLTTTGCTPAQLAQNDLFEWQQRIARSLPAGAGVVCLDSTPNDGADAAAPACDNLGTNNYVVKIWWTDDRNRSGVATVPHRFATPFNR
jgi:type IV pilus assembly protein PilV